MHVISSFIWLLSKEVALEPLPPKELAGRGGGHPIRLGKSQNCSTSTTCYNFRKLF